MASFAYGTDRACISFLCSCWLAGASIKDVDTCAHYSAALFLQAARDLKGLIDDDSAADASVNVEQRHVPGCLLQASALIDGHVNRLALGSERPLDDLDRCLSSIETSNILSDVCRRHQRSLQRTSIQW